MIVPCRGKRLILGAKQRSLAAHSLGMAMAVLPDFQHLPTFLGKTLKDSACFFHKTVKSYNPKDFSLKSAGHMGHAIFQKILVPLPTIFGENPNHHPKKYGYIFPTSLANYQSANDCIYIVSYIYIHMHAIIMDTVCTNTYTCIYVYTYIYNIYI